MYLSKKFAGGVMGLAYGIFSASMGATGYKAATQDGTNLTTTAFDVCTGDNRTHPFDSLHMRFLSCASIPGIAVGTTAAELTGASTSAQNAPQSPPARNLNV
jgi:hypothetical protein